MSARTPAQLDTLAQIEEQAGWHCADGASWQEIAYEDATGDPVIYINDEHEAFILRPDGSLEPSPEPPDETTEGTA